MFTRIFFLIMSISLLLPLTIAYDYNNDPAREAFYGSHDYKQNNGRSGYVKENKFVRDNYLVDYNDNYIRCDYGSKKTKSDSNTVYVTTDYGDSYNTGKTSVTYDVPHARYVTTDYTRPSPRVWSTHYTTNAYGTGTGGTKQYNYDRSGYGSGSGSSLSSSGRYSGSSYTQSATTSTTSGPTFREKRPHLGTYKTYSTPVANTHSKHGSNYEYSVKFYKVKTKSYAYDSYPFN